MDALLSRYWWVLVVRGAFAVTFGVLAFTLPRETAAALVLVFGAYALVDGVLATGSSFVACRMSPDGWILLVQGVIGTTVGALTLAHPAIAAVALLALVAGWAVALGALQMVAAVRLHREGAGEWWLAFGGLLGIVFGLVTVVRPAEGALALLWAIGIYAIGWGVTLLISGFGIHGWSTHATA